MSYVDLVEDAVSQAFEVIEDLKKTMVFVKKGAATFDFNTKAVVGGAEENVEADAVIINSKKHQSTRTVIHRQLLVEVASLSDVPKYDRVVDGATEWQISDIEYATRYIAILNIYREANIDG